MSMALLSVIVPRKRKFPVHVRILPNLWGHTLKGCRFLEYQSDRSMSITHRKSFGVIEILSERKPKSFWVPGKVPGKVLTKPSKTEGPEKFQMANLCFNMFNYLFKLN